MIPERFAPVLDAVGPLAEAFTAAGHRLYLVGGVVRDLLLGVEDPTDYDFTTDALPDEILAVLDGFPGVEAVWTQGKRFGTIGSRIRVGRGDRSRVVDHEITTHRAEAYSPDSRKPEVVFATDIEADLSRRDFTVNAMALSLPDATLVDPFGGTADLAAQVLRTPLAPEESFGDDPLRMLRAARFLTRYRLEPEPALVHAVESMGERLSIVSAERIRDELCRLVVLDDPSPGLWFLADTGLAAQFLPELTAMQLEQDPIHRHKDVLAHTIAVVANTEPGPGPAPRRPVPRHRQAGDPGDRAQRGQLPPPRGGRRPDDPPAHEGAQVLQRIGGRRLPARVPPPAVPRLRRRRLDRRRRASLRPRRGRAAAPAERADPL